MSIPDETQATDTGISNAVERRRNVRFPFSAAVEAVDIKTGAKISGRSTDLGLGGCYMDSLSTFPLGTEARIRIIRENETFEAKVRVVYSLTGMGMGLAFVSAHPDQVQLFQRWLREISGETLPQPPAKLTAKASPAPARTSQTHLPAAAILGDLIMTLIEKEVLSETEGKDLLRKLFV